MGTNSTYNGAYSSNTDPNDTWNMQVGRDKEDLTWLL
jgi:hypothetical protein